VIVTLIYHRHKSVDSFNLLGSQRSRNMFPQRHGQTHKVELSFKHKEGRWIMSRIMVGILIYNRYGPRTPWSWALLERSLVVWTLDSFPTFYGTRRFNTEFTRTLHLSLSWARPIQSISPHTTYIRSILILCNHLRLGLLSGLLPSSFPTNNLYEFTFSPVRATCPAHLIFLALIILIILREAYK
jgi:hypothetical protein